MSEPNWQEKIEEIEAEIFDSSSAQKPQLNNLIGTVQTWFLALPSAGKILVTLLSMVVIISLLNTVFSLIRLMLSLAIIGGIFYFAYRLVNRNTN